MALWNPDNANISMEWWLHGADADTYTLDSGYLAQLADKSGNDRHATSPSGSRPTISAAALNGLNVVAFNGTSQYLSSVFSLNQPTTIYVVAQTNVATGSSGSRQYALDGAGADAYRNVLALRGNQTNKPSIYADSWVAHSASTTTGWAIYKLKFSGASSIIGINGVNNTGNAGTRNANQGFNIGVNYLKNADWLNGGVAEVIIPVGTPTAELDANIIGYLAWEYGLAGNLPADHPYKSAAPTIPDNTSIRNLISQPYALEGSPRALMAQDWNLMLSLRQVVNQDWSLRMLQILAQYYGDVPVVRQLLDQYWGPAALLRRSLAMPYGDALRLRAGIDQDWGLNAGLLAMMEQRYSIAGDRYLALAEQAYNIKDTELIQKLLEQVYIIQPSGITVQKPVTSVTASATSLFPQKTLHPYHIEIEVDEEEFAIKGEIHLADESEWISCVHIETELVIPIDGTEYHLLVEGPWKTRQPGLTEYYVPMASKTILLDAPYADGLEEELGGKMASVITQELANIGNITVDWDMIDWFIPAGILYANGETPLAVIRKIVGAAGGVLQSSPAGDLICRTEYPITVPNWSTASPDFYLTDSDNFFSVSSKPDIRDGFNRFSISDQDEGTQGLTLEEVTINSTTKHILVYQVPFKSTDTIVLRTSGGTWVGVINEGVVTEDILDEQVEIVGGEGNTTKPIYGIIGLPDYKETELGVITTSESGVITTAILENSLVNISYTTKYRKFIVTDPNIEDVQFFPEIQP